MTHCLDPCNAFSNPVLMGIPDLKWQKTKHYLRH